MVMLLDSKVLSDAPMDLQDGQQGLLDFTKNNENNPDQDNQIIRNQNLT